MDILNDATLDFDERYSSDAFNVVQEDHLTFIKDRSTRVIEIDSNLVNKWAGDFYGLLAELKINADQMYITMRINGIDGPTDNFSDLTRLILPDESSLELIRSRFR